MNTSISPPTDNIYKFISISGIVIIILGVYMIVKSISVESNAFDLLINQEDVYGSITDRSSALDPLSDIIDLRISRLESIEDVPNDGTLESLQLRLDQSEQRVSEIESIMRQSDSLSVAYGVIFSHLGRAKRISDRTESIYKIAKHRSDVIFWTGYIILGVGFVVSIYGFRLWWSRVQRFDDIIIRSAAIESYRKM